MPEQSDMAGYDFFASTSLVEPEFRFEFWSDLNQPAFCMKPLDGDASGLEASVESWHSGKISFASMSFRPPDKRPYSIEIGSFDVDLLAVRLYLATDQRGLLGDDSVRFMSGDVHIYPFGQSMRTVTTRLDQVTAYVPFDLVGYDPSTCPSHIVLRSNSPVSRIVKAALLSATEAIGGLGSDKTSTVGEAFAGMIGGIIDGTRSSGVSHSAFQEARGLALRSFINQHIRDQDLGVEKVCGAFGASRATIFREFEEYGGISSFILHQRLERAMIDLATSDASRGRVSEIALRYGFLDSGTFSKAFRGHFGLAPTDYVGQVSSSGPPIGCKTVSEKAANDLRFEDWLCRR